ncbi:MAG: ACP S-malonyltransferase [Sphingomonadales bacterium]|nr:ACP S-malonyltransferase [Sphingomonadales bacterium]
MKQTALVICPGRGSYNAAELGYLRQYHGGGGDSVVRLDRIRQQAGQITVSQLDGAEKFSPSMHRTGDNASMLIYACALADFAAIDRERYDIVAVTGNSMGWYLSLSCAGILDFEAGARLVNNMGTLMHDTGTGGQVIWSMADADWRIDPLKEQRVRRILEQADSIGHRIFVSIRLGAMIVFAGDENALRWLLTQLPPDDRFPVQLNHHAAFHSPLLNAIIPLAQAANPVSDFGPGVIPAIDGQGRIWSPSAFSIQGIYDYTLGAQINQCYDFTLAVQVAAREFTPDIIILTGPGTSMTAPVVQALSAIGWKGLSGKGDFLQRQTGDPLILAMAIAEQRDLVTVS